MTPLEREFTALTKGQFAFLEKQGFTSRAMQVGNFETHVVYRSDRVELRIVFETEDRIFVHAGLLVNGQLADRFDANLNEKLVDFIIDTYFEQVDPGWKTPSITQHIRDPKDIELVLQLYAAELKAHGEHLLAGDQDVFDAALGQVRRGFVLHALEDWARFVHRVREGFDGTIVDYTMALTQRGQLESALRYWGGDRSVDPRSQLKRLDRIFEESTEPIAPETVRSWQLVPSPAAGRWLRKPRILGGPLRDYFTERDR
jgi:hypothetical protein